MSDSDSSSSESVQRPRPSIKPQRLSAISRPPASQQSSLEESAPSTGNQSTQVDSFFRRANTHYVANNVVAILSSDGSDSDDAANTDSKIAKTVNSAHKVHDLNESSDEMSNKARSAKQIDISDDDDDDNERERSLTPPPEFTRTPFSVIKYKSPADGEDLYDFADTSDLIDDVNTTALIDLDPELQAIALDAPEQMNIGSTQDDAMAVGASKIDVLVKTIRHPQLPITAQNALQLAEFERPLLFSMYDTEPFDTLIDAYGKCKQLLKSNIVLVYKDVRLYSRGTPRSLNMANNVEIEAFTMDAFQYVSVERELSRKRKLEELVTGDESISTRSNSKELENDTAVWIHITIRDKTGHDEKIRVRPTTLVSSIISQYARIKQLSNETNIRLELDGERLDANQQVADTELEDDDMLTAIVI
ncbi:ubiquitin-2 like Rad60 SUMO-like-domain-containing protein [Syncephalis fuscata]|nr:ubiquitin-2 like Rad60 SUMO-like-domain-containing protein [Syncephalis fuscata]